MPDLAAGAASLHGPLMIAGFFGVVIGLERAVAIGRGWAFIGPLAAGLGTLALLYGAPWAPWLHVAGAAVLFAATLEVVLRQRALFTFTLLMATGAFVAGCLLWAGGRSVNEVVPWWLAFLVLTIAGERLELSRLRPPSAAAARMFTVIVAAIVLALPAAQTDGAHAAGVRLLGAALIALAGWLLSQDIARRTVRQRGLTRFIAVCLLSGYLWLAIGGGAMLGAGALQPGMRCCWASCSRWSSDTRRSSFPPCCGWPCPITRCSMRRWRCCMLRCCCGWREMRPVSSPGRASARCWAPSPCWRSSSARPRRCCADSERVFAPPVEAASTGRAVDASKATMFSAMPRVHAAATDSSRLSRA
jgi:hypothetical protein